jgi:hypothetical protein
MDTQYTSSDAEQRGSLRRDSLAEKINEQQGGAVIRYMARRFLHIEDSFSHSQPQPSKHVLWQLCHEQTQ